MRFVFLLPIGMAAYRLWQDLHNRDYARPLPFSLRWLVHPWRPEHGSSPRLGWAFGNAQRLFWLVFIAGCTIKLFHPGFSIDYGARLPFVVLTLPLAWFAAVCTVQWRDFFKWRVLKQRHNPGGRSIGNLRKVRAASDVLFVVVLLYAGLVSVVIGVFAPEKLQGSP